MSTLRFIMGDHLSRSVSALQDLGKDDVILMVEVRDEATHIKHHKKKLVFQFACMRHFAEALRKEGMTVDYVRLMDPDNTGSFEGELTRAIDRHTPERIVMTMPSEYHVLRRMRQWQTDVSLPRGIPVDIRSDPRYLVPIKTFAAWAEGRKTLRMEYFYREVRKNHQILMEAGQPVGGQWNYDASNRKKLPADVTVPAPHTTESDPITQDVMVMVADLFADHFGDIEPFGYAVDRTGAREVLETFVRERLPQFGDYQDAMRDGDVWLFHSHIALYLNVGLLEPLECIQAAEAAYAAGAAPLEATEGFIRQIAGWREYVRGLYWYRMPEFEAENALKATRDLPDFFWSADTHMACIRDTVTQTQTHAYAHHIQRLMVIGNFALLAGLDPKQVNEWFWIVYADAFQWVELPNVSGMALFADGGLLASKPYAASGAYINRMSDYCKGCRYDPGQKAGPDACPFTVLYWDFLDRHRTSLEKNARMRMMYTNLDRLSDQQREEMTQTAVDVLRKLSQKGTL